MTAIIITGASSGIGEALALQYATHGVVLGLTGRDHSRLEAVVDACRARGAVVEGIVMDVGDRAGMATWLEGFYGRHGCDLVIANAGVAGGVRGAAPESLDAARAMFKTNIDGVLNTIDPLIPHMASKGRGQIALVSSLAGFRGLAGAPAYAASKGFVKLYGEGLRGSLAPLGIKVSVICPGFVVSRITGLNHFPMPFLMAADKAARIIADGLQKNRARIAFPAPMVFGVWLLAALPATVSDWISRKLPAKD